jgi:hypothetical protein
MVLAKTLGYALKWWTRIPPQHRRSSLMWLAHVIIGRIAAGASAIFPSQLLVDPNTSWTSRPQGWSPPRQTEGFGCPGMAKSQASTMRVMQPGLRALPYHTATQLALREQKPIAEGSEHYQESSQRTPAKLHASPPAAASVKPIADCSAIYHTQGRCQPKPCSVRMRKILENSS